MELELNEYECEYECNDQTFWAIERSRADRQLLKVLATRSNSTDFSFLWINYICRSTICEIADDRIAD